MRDQVLELMKARLGISTNKRDPVLLAIIDGIVEDCKHTNGIDLTENWEERSDRVLFVLDWAAWKYNHPEDGRTPRSIDFRLKNMVIQKACEKDE